MRDMVHYHILGALCCGSGGRGGSSCMFESPRCHQNSSPDAGLFSPLFFFSPFVTWFMRHDSSICSNPPDTSTFDFFFAFVWLFFSLWHCTCCMQHLVSSNPFTHSYVRIRWCFVKRDLHSVKRGKFPSKEPYILSKSKETYVLSKETQISNPLDFIEISFGLVFWGRVLDCSPDKGLGHSCVVLYNISHRSSSRCRENIGLFWWNFASFDRI